MKKKALVVLVVLLGCQWLSAQVKIGTNPQNIDPASVLELESSDRVLVITRISTAQMNAISPYAGALVYNNDEDCIFYYNGQDWLNLCENLGLSFTTEPLVNEFSTIVLTENGDNTHIEVSEIRSENIVDFSISGIDIQNNSINGDKLAPNSVGSEELQDNTITDAEIDYNLVTLNDFINDAGYLVAADLISGDAGNDLSPGTDNGVYFNAEALENAIQANADAIAADGDTDATNEFQNLTLSGNQLAISDGNTVDLSGFNNAGTDDQNLTLAGTTLSIESGNSVDLTGLLDNTDDQNLTSATLDGSNQLTIAIENGNPVTVDLSSLGSSGGTDDQIIDSFTFNNTTNDLSISIEDGNTQTVNLGALAGGGGSTELADQITIIGTGTAGDEFEVNDGAITSAKITDGTIQAVDLGNNAVETAKILDANVTPPKLEPGGANQFLQTDATGTSVSWVDLPAGGTDDQEAFEVPFTPTGNTASTDVQAAIEELQTEIDGISAGGAANPTDELIDLFQLNGTSLEIGEGANLPTPIDFDAVFATDAELAGLSVDDADADPANEIQDLASVLSEGADANATVITNAADPVDPQDVATKAYVDANTGGVIVSADVPNSITAGTDGGALYDDPDSDPNNEIQDLASVLTEGADANATVISNAADPVSPQDVATKAYVDANIVGVIVSADAPNSISVGTDGGALYDDPDADPNNEIELPPGGTSGQVLSTDGAGVYSWVNNAGGGIIVSADSPNSITAGTDGGALYDDPDADPNNEIELPAGGNAGQILSTDGAGVYTWVDDANDGEHTGTTGSVFFADNTTGAPTEDNDSFFWDVSKRFGTGALGVGIDGGTFSDVAKVHIAESIAGQLVYPLHLENKVGDGAPGSSVGLLLGVENAGGYGKGAIVFERTTSFARGDVHILNNNALTTVSPTLADAVFTAKADGNIGIGITAPTEKLHVAGNIKLDADIIAQTGAGNDGDVLTNTAAGIEWLPASAGIVNVDGVTIDGDGVGTPLFVPDGAITTTQILDGTIATVDIADDNVTVEKINAGASGDVLTTNGTGDVVWAPASAGAVSTDLATIVGDGTAGNVLQVPNGGITTGEILDGTIASVDIDDGQVMTADLADDNVTVEKINAGNNGDVLTTDAAGDVVWAPAAAGSVNVDGTSIVGNGVGTPLSVGTDGIDQTHIADNAIFFFHMSDGSVMGGLGGTISDGSITSQDLGANSVGTSELINSSVTPVKIQAGADGEVLTSSGGVAQWAAPTGVNTNLGDNNLVQSAADRTYDLNNGNLRFINTGNVAIGTIAPQSKLDVDGQVSARNGFAASEGSAGNPGYGFLTNNDTDTGMYRIAENQLGLTTGGTEALRIDASQNVGIGITPTERLHVNGNILATGTITPDYVFEAYFAGKSERNPGYRVLNLNEIETFIAANYHLPGVPSASEVQAKGGILVNRATEINLEKIEELFLHTIEQEKKIDNLTIKNQELEAEVQILKNEIELIKEMIKNNKP